MSEYCYIVKNAGIEVLVFDLSELPDESEMLVAIASAEDFVMTLSKSYRLRYTILDISGSKMTDQIRESLKSLDNLTIRQFGVSILRNYTSKKSYHLMIGNSFLQRWSSRLSFTSKLWKTEKEEALFHILNQYA